MHELATERATTVPERLKHLASMRAAMVAGCEWCLDFGSFLSKGHGVTEDEMRELPHYRDSDAFDETEKLVMDYATGMTRSPVDVSDELFAKLRERFDEAQLVELTDIIALENYRARFNWAFGLEGQGFSEGAYCVPPERAPRRRDAASEPTSRRVRRTHGRCREYRARRGSKLARSDQRTRDPEASLAVPSVCDYRMLRAFGCVARRPAPSPPSTPPLAPGAPRRSRGLGASSCLPGRPCPWRCLAAGGA